MLTHPNFDPVAISIGPISIHWYGLMYLVGFSAAWFLATRRAKLDQYPVTRAQVDDLIFYSALGVVLGGRFGYVFFYNFDKFLLEPLWLFKVWEGGMSFHGGLLGVITAMFIYAKRINITAGQLLDFVAPLVPIGLGLGRIGNFIGQELWGRPTDVAWGMVFTTDPDGLARHPSQLYQAGLEGLLLFIIVYWFSRLPRPPWSVGGVFLAGYGCMRFFAEFFRQPDSHIGFDAFGWLTRGQLLSVPMIVIGLMLVVFAYRRQMQSA
ncbi:MAG: prolipoprotein diacylglyceryl transferase [Spongiibacteraceae bacterium]|nr:prolipoprotein diacylglyceryl transferase [Spongiibacteraceae bacterium]